MTVITGGKLVLPDEIKSADLCIENGVIKYIGADYSIAPEDDVIDAKGMYVFPGFIDSHTHLDMDNGVTVTADDFSSGTKAALSGGTTTIIDFATQDKGGSLIAALETWQRKAESSSSCDYAFHMAICDWNEGVRAELSELKRRGVTSFKLYMAYDALKVNDDEILDILCTIKDLGGIVGVHCENGDLITTLSAELVKNGKTSPEYHPISRPPELEAEAVNRLLYIAKLADCPVNIVHLSSECALNEVRIARKRGQRVFVESCPQYFLLDDGRYSLPGFEGAKYVMSPPLRKKSDNAALIKAMTDDEIDTIATDHCSYRFDTQKSLGKEDFTKIPNGSPGIEHRPPLMYGEFVETGKITVNQFSRLLSENPARLFGLYPQKGALKIGSDADIVIWNPESKWTITAKEQYQSTDYTPFEGMEIKGRAEYVLLGGKIAARAGRVTSEGNGRYIPRHTADGDKEICNV